MNASSPIVLGIARKSDTLIRKRLASFGQKPLADAIGKSETWVSRWKDEDITRTCEILSALGLKVTPSDQRCFPDEHIRALEYFARIGMKTDALGLDWGEPE